MNDIFLDTICYLSHGRRVFFSALGSAFSLLNSFLSKCEILDLAAVDIDACERDSVLRFIMTPDKPQQFYCDIKQLVNVDA